MRGTPPRVAILTPYNPSDYHGGVEVFSEQLSQTLENVEIFAGATPSRAPAQWNLGRIGMDHPYRALHVTRSFLQRHRQEPFEFVVSNGLYGWPLSLRRLNVPMVQVYHFTMAELGRRALDLPGDRLTTSTVGAFFDSLAGRGKHVVAVSPSLRWEVKQHYGLDAQVIPNAVDTTLFRKRDRLRARDELGLPPSATIGLFVGRPEYAKGYDVFLEVARSMRDLLFVRVGRFPDVEPKVRTVLGVSHSLMPQVYAAADFLFLPSRYEGFNLSILEALACDLPIVVSKMAYPFAEEPSRYGYVVASLRTEEFVRAIRDVLRRAGSYAPREAIMSMYSLDVFRENWRRLVETLLADGLYAG